MTQLIQEYVDSRNVSLNVDREAGVLRGVKLLGFTSRNGRTYREAALQAAVPLYEEAKVNVNHSKGGPLVPRDYQDRLGVIRGVEFRNGEGLFGNLYFNPKHALAEQLLWDAEHNPHNVGFSHNVEARLTRAKQTTVVEEITKVQSVDLVADPATTQGLFEQANDEKQQLAVESQQVQRLQQQLSESESQVAALQRKQRVLELLCEHQLTISRDEKPAGKAVDRGVSPEFVELLTTVIDDRLLEQLVAEQARLVHEAATKQRVLNSVPFSRDQTLLLAHQSASCRSAKEFADTLKSSRN